MLPVTLPAEQVDKIFQTVEAEEGYCLTVNLESQSISDDSGVYYSFEVDPFRRDCLLKGVDDIGITLQYEDKIKVYENQIQPRNGR